MINLSEDILKLIEYAQHNGLLKEEDKIYAINKICDLLDEKNFKLIDISDFKMVGEPSALLDPLLNSANTKNLINPDTITRRDIFEAKIMDCLLPRPSELNHKFNSFKDTVVATDWYYNLSIKSNYIKTSRTSKNVIWKSKTKYGNLDMTINLSKPEKDPRDIIAAGNKTKSSHPQCLLCKENVGYNGASTNVGRTSHRIIPLNINNEEFYLQYSPYVYYNEHCIVLKKEHEPMNVTINTFKRLFDFVDQFPHYFLGSNAGLPIVGGSILSHEHYQGGRHSFPIERAKVLNSFIRENVTYEQLYWPLSVIRLSSKDKNQIIDHADKLFKFWENYSDKEAGIYAYTEDVPHNAITPIARKEDDLYIVDMTLRNNLTSEELPLGIFHPHPGHHHIKKENIGLIEVMGLAVLPARLNDEIPALKEALLNNKELTKYTHHQEWLKYLKSIYKNEDIDIFINDQITIKFMKCIEDSGVFKQTDEGIKQFNRFVKELSYV
ncbi:Galactose-1-phosphate uridylyltransferase [Candidatus Izimaplasma bacterium HR1]|jgi:UDPglucose--hexose-1-phosphate uridylyltransferase|uniref:UDP-glucose--hexose-1-phosphate uridylyltransferase n=1 Tax=Candidatus Izimoplasma sp. HR1 TaxID=1541959 RepID=UPI0004F8A80B|nr:Galactose-1-phosphate uridylyltransferase [Candidatus Izimaplasma bacterium HR1]